MHPRHDRRQIRQRPDNETIHSRKKALRHSLIVEIVPLLQLTHANVETWNNAGSTGDGALNVPKKSTQNGEQYDPQQPGLHKANRCPKQRVAKVNHRYFTYNTMYRGSKNVYHKDSTKEYDNVRDDQ